jgi:predicted TIM-barrel fold metal-dependent hydrolase
MQKLIEWTRRFSPSHPVPDDVSLDTLLEEYAASGVDRVWNFAHALFPDEPATLNEWNWQLGRAHPRILPFGTCHPLTPEPLAVIDRCFDDYGFPGLKLHPFVQRFTPWAPAFLPWYERVARHRGIVVFHTGFDHFYGGHLPLSGFEAILADFPEMTVILAHAGYPRVAEAFALVARFPNVYVDTVHVLAPLTATWDPGDQQVAQSALREGLARFPDRVLFGTDHPAGTSTLAAMYADAQRFGMTADTERRVLGETAARLTRRSETKPAHLPIASSPSPGAAS